MMLPLLLDCDGVLADFCGAVCQDLDIDPAEVTTFDHFKRPEFKGMFYDWCEWRANWEGISPMPGAQAAVDELRGAKIPILVVTAPWVSCDGWASERFDWLKRHYGIKPAGVIVTSQKHLVSGCGLVEDRADTLKGWVDANLKGGWLYDQLYNREVADHPLMPRGTWECGLAEEIIKWVKR